MVPLLVSMSVDAVVPVKFIASESAESAVVEIVPLLMIVTITPVLVFKSTIASLCAVIVPLLVMETLVVRA